MGNALRLLMMAVLLAGCEQVTDLGDPPDAAAAGPDASVGTPDATAVVPDASVGPDAALPSDAEVLPQPPLIQPDRTTVGFGSVYLGAAPEETVQLTNAGQETLTLTAVSVTGANADLFTARIDTQSVASLQKAILVVTYAPTAAGAHQAELVITSNSSVDPTLSLALTGTAQEPAIAVHIKATTAPFAHADALAGQTTQATRAGVRSLKLLRSSTDPAPMTLFDLGADTVEVGYDDGDDTLVARVPTAGLTEERFTLARLVQTYSRYRLAATRHSGGTSTEGELDNLLVVSDGARVDGVVHDKGHYVNVFTPTVGAATTYQGENGLVPVYSSTAGAYAVLENGEWAVYFPVDLTVGKQAWTGKRLDVTVNMDRAFRWQDNLLGFGYLAGVFDFEPPYYEPVYRFGGNAFEASVE